MYNTPTACVEVNDQINEWNPTEPKEAFQIKREGLETVLEFDSFESAKRAFDNMPSSIHFELWEVYYLPNDYGSDHVVSDECILSSH